jgi:hypothetical protein
MVGAVAAAGLADGAVGARLRRLRAVAGPAKGAGQGERSPPHLMHLLLLLACGSPSAVSARLACAAWLVSLAVASAAPTIVVGELFHDLLAFPRAKTGGPTCPLNNMRRYREANAPWLNRAHLASETVPTLRELRETMLSEAFVFNASLRHCVGDPSVMPRGLDPPGLCVQGFPHLGSPMLFDQYSLEVVLLMRWLQEAPICDEGSQAPICGHPGIVVVPSLVFHHTAAVGRSWLWKYCMTAPLASEYWRRVAARYFTPGEPGPLVVVAESYSWDQQVGLNLLIALSAFPAEFRARVVILTTMSNQQSSFRRIPGFAPPWQSGADAELLRRALLQQERWRLGALDAKAARALLPSAPLMLTVPKPVGVFDIYPRWAERTGDLLRPRPIGVLWNANILRTGKQLTLTRSNVRKRISSALVAANATCNQDRSRCVMCHSPGCAELRPTVFGDAARSALCIEPPGDTLGRSHAFVDIIAGCIPVLVEGSHPAYPKGEPTWWPWRAAPEAPGALPVAASPLRGLTLDYGAFSLLPDGGTICWL